ncbi:MAG: hypothetical protein SWK90_13245 [Chloroflexota bacterium]|nr:hypothetical protein [Chloroflexota bacterium]
MSDRRMNDRMTATEVENLILDHFSGILMPVGDFVYRVNDCDPKGVVQVLYVFGEIRELVEKFIPYLEVYFLEPSVRNGIIDKNWVDYTLDKLRQGDNHSLDNMIRRALTDGNGDPEGRLFRFVVAMLRAGNPSDIQRSVTLADLRERRCLAPFRGEIGEIAHELHDRGIVTGTRNKYHLRVLIPLFSRAWWESYEIGW